MTFFFYELMFAMQDAKSKASTSNTIMASVWKFHQEEHDETSATSSV